MKEKFNNCEAFFKSIITNLPILDLNFDLSLAREDLLSVTSSWPSPQAPAVAAMTLTPALVLVPRLSKDASMSGLADRFRRLLLADLDFLTEKLGSVSSCFSELSSSLSEAFWLTVSSEKF